MKKLLLTGLLCLFTPVISHANAELVQIVAFTWDDNSRTLNLLSLGSGTAIDKNLVITNKHIVKVGTDQADFILLCPAQSDVSKEVTCSIAAGISALHPDIDAALVRPLDDSVFLPSVRTSNLSRDVGDIIRIVGFPAPDAASTQNFGSDKTIEAFKRWEKNQEADFTIKGDSPTTTRGQVLARLQFLKDQAIYTKTDAKTNFGNSGGAAFNQFGEYIGIPTLGDSAGNSYILEYAQLQGWIEDKAQHTPQFASGANDYYETLTSRSIPKEQPEIITESIPETSPKTIKRSPRQIALYERLKQLRSDRANSSSMTSLSSEPGPTAAKNRLAHLRKLLEQRRAEKASQ